MSAVIDDNLFSPGEFIRDEIGARGWTQEDLAVILGRPLKTVNHIISAKKQITPQTAQELAAAFGTSAALWMNLETAYRLGLEKQEQDSVARRANLYELAPVKDMIRRGWIAEADTVDELEAEVCRFFGIAAPDQEPRLAAAARRSSTHADLTPAQRAWLFRAKNLASVLQAKKYSKAALEKYLPQLHALTVSEQEIRKVPEVLTEMGIRFVVVEHLPRTKIDGAAFWLDRDAPVIVLSLRYGRIDGFWHTLIHELNHIRNRDGVTVDNDLVGSSRRSSDDEMERRADRAASEFLISASKLNSFIARVRPRFSKQRIVQFANLHQVHPGIVVGQLQYRDAIRYSHSREMLVDVRSIVTESTLTDGWGVDPSV